MADSPLQNLIDAGIQAAANADNRNHRTHPYFSPSDEPLGWQTKGRCVRLDVAIYALHIFAAKTAFRSFSGLVRQKQDGVLRQLIRSAGAFLAAKVAGEFFRTIFDSVNVLRGQFDAEKAQQDFEAAIRRQSIQVQRELLQNVLGQAKRPRKTRLVMSRHKTPYQRKANKSWQPT